MMMDNVCSICGYRHDVELSGEIFICATGRSARSQADARLRFAKWVVEHGKITAFPGKVDELFQQSTKINKS